MEGVLARARIGFRVDDVLAVLFISAGIHAALVAIHAGDDPGLAAAFATATVLEIAVALLLARRPGRPMLGAAAALLAGLVVAYLAALVVHLPGTEGTPEDPDVIGVATKLIELFGAVAALALAHRPPVGLPPLRLRRSAPLGIFAAVFVLSLGHQHGHSAHADQSAGHAHHGAHTELSR